MATSCERRVGHVGRSSASGTAPSGSIRASRSYSFSHTRRPMAASSTERVWPVRWVAAWMMHITPHLSVPSTSHQRADARGPPVGRRRPRRRRRAPPARRSPPTGPGPPKRQARTQSQPRSSSGSPRWASSQSRTARSPSGRRSGSRGGSRRGRPTRPDGGGRSASSQRKPSSKAGWGCAEDVDQLPELRDLVRLLEAGRARRGRPGGSPPAPAPHCAVEHGPGRRRSRRRAGCDGGWSRRRPGGRPPRARPGRRRPAARGHDLGHGHAVGAGGSDQAGFGGHAAAGADAPRPLPLEDESARRRA